MPHDAAMPTDIHRNRTLWLLSIAHAVNHAQAVLLPLVYIRIIAEFGVTADTIALLAASGQLCVGGGPAELREADPDDLAAEAPRRRWRPVR